MEKTKDATITEKLLWALTDPKAVELAKVDFIGTFTDLGQDPGEAEHLTTFIFQNLEGVTEQTLAAKELIVGEMIKCCKAGILTLPEVLTRGIQGRSQLIYDQVGKYFEDVTGRVVDFGCGNGVVAQLLHEGNGLNIVGYDVVNYTTPGVTIPTHLFDGTKLPVDEGYFSAAVVTNVFHHSDDPDVLLKELTRTVTTRLVIIETVPDPVSEEKEDTEMRRVYLNDYLYNRLFNPGVGIPVPGTYRTPKGWIGALEVLGWTVVESIDLGVDQKCIRDRHHLLVVDR